MPKSFFFGKSRLIVPVPIGKYLNFIRYSTSSTDGYEAFINLSKGYIVVRII